MFQRTVYVVSVGLALGATEMKYVHLNIAGISACRFTDGVCEETSPIYLDEQRGLASLTSTGDISVELVGQAVASSQGSLQ